MKQAILLVLSVSLISGCASVEEKAATGVMAYCAVTLPAERAVIRARVNEKIAPNSVQINCADQQ